MSVTGWRQAVEQAADLQSLAGGLQRGEAPGVYSASVRLVENQLFFMVREDLEKLLVVVAEKEDCPFEAQAQVLGSFHVFLAELNSANAEVMRRLFPGPLPRPLAPQGFPRPWGSAGSGFPRPYQNSAGYDCTPGAGSAVHAGT